MELLNILDLILEDDELQDSLNHSKEDCDTDQDME